MNDIVITVIVSITSSAGFTGAAVFLLKKYFEQRIKFRFDKELEVLKADHQLRLEQLKCSLGVQQTVHAKVLSEHLDAWKEVSGLVYGCRDLALQIVQRDAIHLGSLAADFAQAVKKFNDSMTAHRLLLQYGPFPQLHQFKHDLASFDSLLRLGIDEAPPEHWLNDLKRFCTLLDADYAGVLSCLQSLSVLNEWTVPSHLKDGTESQ